MSTMASICRGALRVGGWAGIGLAAGLTKGTEGLGAVGGYAALSNYTALGGQLTVLRFRRGSNLRLAIANIKRPAFMAPGGFIPCITS